MARRGKKTDPLESLKLDPTQVVLKMKPAEPKRTKQIQIRLDEGNMAFLQRIARAQGKGHTTLAREVVEAYIAAIREQLKAAEED